MTSLVNSTQHLKRINTFFFFPLKLFQTVEEEGTLSLIFQGQYYSDSKTRQGHHKQRKS